MRGYGLNKHFTTNQDFKCCPFKGLPVEADPLNRSPYLLSDESMFSLGSEFSSRVKGRWLMRPRLADAFCSATAGKASPRPRGGGEGVRLACGTRPRDPIPGAGARV